MKFRLVENLNEAQERTVYNALAAWPRYAYKYGVNSAFLELKYNFNLTNEEMLWILDKLENKGYINEYSKEYAINSLNLKENLDEDYLDDEEEFWDYETDRVVDKDIFDINKGESPYAKEMIKLSKTGGVNEKGLGAEIIQMTPREYMEQVAKGFNSTFDRQIKQMEYDKGTIDHLKQVLLKYKRKFPITYLNVDSKYGNFEQEGRHRMYTAGELFGWDTKFPVLKIFEKDKEKANKFKLEELKEEYNRILSKALRKSEVYNYKSLDELKEQIEYELEREFSWREDPKFTLDVKEGNDHIRFILNNLTIIDRDKEDFNIDPNKSDPTIDDDEFIDSLDDEDIAQMEKELGIKFNESLNESTKGLGKVVIKAIVFQTNEQPKKDLQLFKGFDKDGIYNLDENTFIAFEKRYKNHPEGWSLIHQDIVDRWIKNYFPDELIARCKDFYLEIDNGGDGSFLYYDVNDMKKSPIFKYYADDIKNAINDYFEI